MSRLTPIAGSTKLKRRLDSNHLNGGEVPNFLRVLANSPAALRAYVLAEAALARGQLTPRERELIGLAVAEINGSSYNLSAHYDAGKRLGLTPDEMQLARRATAVEPRAAVMLRFTQAVVLQRGEVSDDDFGALRVAGFTDSQTVEIIAQIALSIFRNYFNGVAKTEVDFQLLQPGTDVPRGDVWSASGRMRRTRSQVTKSTDERK